MATEFHSAQVNTANDRELHGPGWVVNDYTALLAVTVMLDGDVAYVKGSKQWWWYDAALGVWRAMTRFYTTSSQLGTLLGVQPGDEVFLTDTGQTGFFSGSGWNYVG